MSRIAIHLQGKLSDFLKATKSKYESDTFPLNGLKLTNLGVGRNFIHWEEKKNSPKITQGLWMDLQRWTFLIGQIFPMFNFNLFAYLR